MVDRVETGVKGLSNASGKKAGHVKANASRLVYSVVEKTELSSVHMEHLVRREMSSRDMRERKCKLILVKGNRTGKM